MGWVNEDFQEQPKDKDKNLFVEFYVRPVKNEYKSKLENRTVADNVDFIRVFLSAKTTFENAYEDCSQNVKDQFKEQYLKWKSTQGTVTTGTPIEQWALIDPASCYSMKAQGIFTIEQLSSLSDMQVQGLGMGGRELREKAKLYLRKSDEDQDVYKLVDEVEVLKSMVKELSKELIAQKKAKESEIKILTEEK